jgi:hypothetical protein
LYEPVGSRYSSFMSIEAQLSGTTRRNRMSGVFLIAPRMPEGETMVVINSCFLTYEARMHKSLVSKCKLS